MRMALRSSLPLVLAAAAFALARSEGAAPPSATVEVEVEANDDTPALPRVLPPRRPALEPIRPTPPAAAPAAMLVGRPPAVAAAPAPLPVDLLAPPDLPARWSRPPARPTPVVAATLGRPAPVAYPMSLTPAPLTAHTAAVPLTAHAPPAPSKQAIAAAPPVVSRPTLTPLAATPPAPAKRTWPAAFVTKDGPDGEAKPAAYSEKPNSPEPAAPRPAPAGATPDDLRQRVQALCGRDAAGVVVAKEPNGFVVVRVPRPRGRDGTKSDGEDPETARNDAAVGAPGARPRAVRDAGRRCLGGA